VLDDTVDETSADIEGLFWDVESEFRLVLGLVSEGVVR
jgi:hypothetical protein